MNENDSNSTFSTLESYPWSSSAEFQAGLSAILGSSNTTTPRQAADLALRARCFFYQRKYGTNVDYVAYATWRATQPLHALTPLDVGGDEGAQTAQTDGGEAVETPKKGAGLGAVGELRSPSPSPNSKSIVKEGKSLEKHEQGEEVKPAQASNSASFQQILEMIQSGTPVPGIQDIPKTVLEGQATPATRNVRQKPWERAANSQAQSSGGLFNS